MHENSPQRGAEARGGCQCGAVRYVIRSAVESWDCTLCHCRMCQKASGGPFMVFVNVAADSVDWTGERALFRSSSVAGRGFCQACGTPLTYEHRPEQISIAHGTLDDPTIASPTSQLVDAAALPWSSAVAGLPVTPLSGWLAALPAPIQSYQYPDHDA